VGWSVNRATGLTHYDPSQATFGYTLVTPGRGDGAYLIDLEGRIVHRWSFENLRPSYGRLLDNGNLLMSAVDANEPAPPEDEPTRKPPSLERHVMRLGGHRTSLVEVDWHGNVVWRYDNHFQHHDFIRLPNGNTMFPEWVELPARRDKAVQGGYRLPREKLPPMLGDDLVEINAEGKEVRRIEAWKLFDPRRDPISPVRRRWEWMHLNGLDINDAGDIAISCPQMDRIGVIDAKTGKLRLKFKDVHFPHHVTWVGDDSIQVFNNGRNTSQVLEICVSSGEVTWNYQGAPVNQFFSSYLSSAERLGTGSVLVCEGSSGRLFEVTREQEVVWEWINPFKNQKRNGDIDVTIYRAHRYPADHPAFAGRSMDPDNHRDLNQRLGLR